MQECVAKGQTLFIAQGFDRVEAGGFDGRIHAEEQADAHGDGDGEDDSPQWNGGGQRGHSEIDEQADGPAKDHADDAAGAGEDDGFG